MLLDSVGLGWCLSWLFNLEPVDLSRMLLNELQNICGLSRLRDLDLTFRSDLESSDFLHLTRLVHLEHSSCERHGL